MRRLALCAALLASALPLAAGLCPLSLGGAPLPAGHPPALGAQAGRPRVAAQGYAEALAALDFRAIKRDLVQLFTSSQSAWPADYGDYAPLFVRLAWHCSGSYRASDGRGGCDGGRQRFDPERSWDDNTNLDKARRLLEPLKVKYGAGLSWGDLFVLAGTTAIEHMGGPWAGFCAGRIDDDNGRDSEPLGPSAEQELLAPCGGLGQPAQPNGNCSAPLGASTIGLIYVNPHGPMGVPDPAASAPQIREVFARMGWNDAEAVALIGGGHAFGKAHGACPGGPGASPAEDPAAPWAGTCGSGKGADATTAGFEGSWTSWPLRWDNEYFTNLLQYEHAWARATSPGGATQWQVPGSDGPTAPNAHDSGARQPLMMLTTDVALLHDGAYRALVQHFADDLASLTEAFGAAWYKLVTRDSGPATRCAGDLTPSRVPAWQHPLPPAPDTPPDWQAVRADVAALLPERGAELVRLAWLCASTFRASDYQGGCNGARIRHAPGKDWPENAGADAALDALAPVHDAHADLSWADLIVLAGTAAVERAMGHDGGRLPFCGGRTDAADGDGWKDVRQSAALTAALAGETSDVVAIAALLDKIELLGLSRREFVALAARRAPRISSDFFVQLLGVDPAAPGATPRADMLLTLHPELRSAAVDFAADSGRLLAEFGAAWSKVMNADRFDGPTGSVCAGGAAGSTARGAPEQLDAGDTLVAAAAAPAAAGA
jgi:catalase/peroxidase HPI